MAGHGHGRFLNDIVGFAVRQTSADREIARQLGVDSVELVPTLTIVSGPEPVEQAGSSLDGTGLVGRHRSHCIHLNVHRQEVLQSFVKSVPKEPTRERL